MTNNQNRKLKNYKNFSDNYEFKELFHKINDLQNDSYSKSKRLYKLCIKMLTHINIMKFPTILEINNMFKKHIDKEKENTSLKDNFFKMKIKLLKWNIEENKRKQEIYHQTYTKIRESLKDNFPKEEFFKFQDYYNEIVKENNKKFSAQILLDYVTFNKNEEIQ